MQNGTPESQRDLPQITLAESKTFLREVTEDLFSRMPEDQILEDTRRPDEKNTLLGCSDDMEDPFKDGVFLTYGGTVYFSGDADLRPMMDQIYEDYSSKAGWQTSWSSPSHELAIKILSPNNYQFYIDVSKTSASNSELMLLITSFGPCIPTPPGYNAATDFEY
jgi:hypothetical protein